MNRKRHWDKVWAKAQPDKLSWFQPEPEVSLELIEASGIERSARVIDVGGGASLLVDRLLERGYTNLAVLDLSEAAIGHAKTRLGDLAEDLRWYTKDVTDFCAEQPFDLWHDRAVLHFLTTRRDQQSYVKSLLRSLDCGGHVIISTFALDGPKRCIGRRVIRYGPQDITALLGPCFRLLDTVPETHLTPGKIEQRFTYFRLKRVQ
jgi:2-polyprenyl-3-methyl-5-hydroxy-6-metoxy-1,4-benzoquinol methylase